MFFIKNCKNLAKKLRRIKYYSNFVPEKYEN